MDESLFSESDSHSTSQEIPRLIWNRKFHYRVQITLAICPEPDASSQQHPTQFPQDIIFLSKFPYKSQANMSKKQKTLSGIT
jgi:hypothetical protein